MDIENENNENVNKIFCKHCNKYITKSNITHHNKKPKHNKNKDNYNNVLKNDLISKIMVYDTEKLENIKLLLESMKY